MSRFAQRTQRTGVVDDFLPNVSRPEKYLRNSEGMPWVRPSDWLNTTPVAATEICFLYAVYQPDSNFLQFSVTTSSGNFTVDWGNGTSNSYASGTSVAKQFLWASYGNLSARGYRQARVRITGNITGVNFNLRHASVITPSASSQIVEISAQGSSITSFTMSASSVNITHLSLENFAFIGTCSITSMARMFSNCNALQSVSLPNTAAVTNMSNMFGSCYSLQSVSLTNTSAVTNMNSMFSGCSSLQSVSLTNTAAVTDMGGMFSSCSSLQSVSLPNTAAVTDMGGMFSSCYNLQSVSLANTAAVYNMAQMFNNCYGLQSVTGLSGASAYGSGTYTSMFNNCPSLQSISATNMKFTHSIQYCKLSATYLNAYYTALPTVSAQTLSVTGNWGTATDNPAIATAKGWTVTG